MCGIKWCQGLKALVCILPLAALFMMAGCSGATYFCENGKIIKARDQLSHEKVVIDLGEGDIILPRVPAAEGSKFSDGRRTFWFKGDELTAEVGGKTPYGRCVLQK